MASTLDVTQVDAIHGLLRGSKWDDAVALYERELSREERRAAPFRLAYAIALIRIGREPKGFSLLGRDETALPNARVDLRRYAVSPLIAAGSLEPAAKLLDLIVGAKPDSLDDLRLRASVRTRLKQWDGAVADARTVAAERSDDLNAQRSYVQILLQAGRLEEAGAEASALSQEAISDVRLFNIALLALTRSGRSEEAASLALQMADSHISDEATAAAIVRTLLETGHGTEAIEVGERLIEEGWEHEVLRASLGQAYLASRDDDRHERAIAHFREGLEMEPRDARMNLAIGDTLLRTRQYEAALPYLRTACEVQPKAAQPRALYARALKQVGRYADAAQEFRALLELQPSSARWARYAAGALSQSGSRSEADDLFQKFVAARRAQLPKNFERGLQALWDRVDTAKIPQARLDWAWDLSNQGANDRNEWERRAKWGHLADHYLLDWLECREDRIHDAMTRLADLGDAERVLAGIDSSKGMIVASAHIGPMYAGPLALELLGVRSKWLASTPSVARTAYAKSLISTSEQDDMEVGKAFIRALRQGYSVIIAVDGAINLAAPRVPFEGQEMTYSSFAARTAHRLGVPCVFAAPRWEGERIGFVLKRLPDPLPDESADAHAERWRDAFFATLRDYLGGPPENLRLSGGLWRHVR